MRKTIQITALFLALAVAMSGCSFFESSEEHAQHQAEKQQSAEPAAPEQPVATDSNAAEQEAADKTETDASASEPETVEFAITDEQWNELAAGFAALEADYTTLSDYFEASDLQGELILSDLLASASDMIAEAGALKHSEFKPEDVEPALEAIGEMDTAILEATEEYFAEAESEPAEENADEEQGRKPLVKKAPKAAAPAETAAPEEAAEKTEAAEAETSKDENSAEENAAEENADAQNAEKAEKQ